MKLTDNDFDADFVKVRTMLRMVMMERTPAEKRPIAELAMTEMVDPLLHVAQRFLSALEGIEQNTRGGIK